MGQLRLAKRKAGGDTGPVSLGGGSWGLAGRPSLVVGTGGCRASHQADGRCTGPVGAEGREQGRMVAALWMHLRCQGRAGGMGVTRWPKQYRQPLGGQ